MILGAIAAIGQTNIKRLIAYSSIGHIGYALAGIATGTVSGSDVFASYGVSTVTKNSTGNYTVTFDTPFSSADSYTTIGTCGGTDFTGYSRTFNPVSFTANACNFVIDGASGGANDTPYISVVFYGNGENGAVDIKGQKGAIGPSGGEKGSKGQKGIDGVTGTTGTKGDKGVGDKGTKGQDGAAVAKGQKGEAEKGQKGIEGNEGAFSFSTAYVSFLAKSSFSFSSDEITSHNVSTVVRVSAGVYDVYWSSGTFSSANIHIQFTATETDDSSSEFIRYEIEDSGTSANVMRFNTRPAGSGPTDTETRINILAMG